MIHDGRMVEGTDSSNTTASTQGVRAGTETNMYNTRIPDVPSGYLYTEEAKAAGLEAEAVWYAEHTMTPTTTDNENSGEGHDISGDDGIRDGGPGHDRDQDNEPQASMEAIMHNRMLNRWDQHQAYNNQENIANGPDPISEEQKQEFETRLEAMNQNYKE